MRTYKSLEIQASEQSVLNVLIDVPNESMNVFNDVLLSDLENLLDDLEATDASRAIVFRSGKPSGFLAGADLKQFSQLKTNRDVEAIIFRGQELFRRIANLPMPTVAVIEGVCLGGGLEFAMACDYRVAVDRDETKLGLPETQLGLIPGWGGTQRLPKLVGLTRGVQMILAGKRLDAQRALRHGLVDAVVPISDVEMALERFVNDVLHGDVSRSKSRSWSRWFLDRTDLGNWLVMRSALGQVRKSSRRYPALPAALRAIRAGLDAGLDAGLATECKEFVSLVNTSSTRNLLHLFFNRERARSSKTWSSETPSGVNTIGVLGAGVMGIGIAQVALLASYEVIVRDLNEDILKSGKRKLESLLNKALSKGVISVDEFETCLDRVSFTQEIAPFHDVDLVIEAIVEDMNIKQKAFAELDVVLPEHAILVSNTSALSVTKMAESTQRPDRVAGLHFFNPVHKMPLIEVVRGKKTSEQTLATLVKVAKRLGKSPIVVEDAPGFLVNRILFPYLDEAVRLATEGVPVNEIDREAVAFGMPMGPIELLDTVGIDVAAHVAKTLSQLSLEESPTPELLAHMVERGELGLKTGKGFYTYRDGQRHHISHPPVAKLRELSDVQAVQFDGEELSPIQLRLVAALMIASVECLENNIVEEPWMVDLGMILGTGFPPFRGGPIRLIDQWGIGTVAGMMEDLAEVCGPRFSPPETLVVMADEKRSFFEINNIVTESRSDKRKQQTETLMSR